MVAIVTGGSKGIGLAIARALLDRGGQVAISARSESDLKIAAQALGGGPSTALGTGDVLTVRADVREPSDAACWFVRLRCRVPC